jgi:hypothetical protein
MADEDDVTRSPEETEKRIPQDPLSSVTRRERKVLLAVSGAGLTIALTGAVPTEIATLGIRFEPGDQRVLLWVFGVVVAYFLFTFLSYAMSDFAQRAWEFTRARVQSDPEYRVGEADKRFEARKVYAARDELIEVEREQYILRISGSIDARAREVFGRRRAKLMAISTGLRYAAKKRCHCC